MNANKMSCKSRFLSLMQMLFDKDANAIFMMQVSYVGMKMQSLSMMRSVHIFKSWCKCFLVEVEMQKSHGANALLWVCYDANAFCRDFMMQMLWCKHNLFKNSLCFQNQGFLGVWNQKYFQILICYFSKSHLLILSFFLT